MLRSLVPRLHVTAIVISLLMCATLGGRAQSTSFYVAPNGADSNPGTQALPWATLAKAVATLTAGQTAYLANGIYHVAANRIEWYLHNGTAGAPITIAGLPGHRPVITDVLQMSGQHLVLRNLVFDRNSYRAPTPSLGLWIYNSDHVTVEDCEFRNTAAGGLYIERANNILITRNYIHDVGEYDPARRAGQGHGIYYHDGGIGSVISNNVIVRAWDYGIQLYPTPTGVVVANNTIVASGTRQHVGGGGAGIALSGRNLTVVNNIIANNLEGAITTFFDETSLDGAGNRALNNVYWNNGARGDYINDVNAEGLSNEPAGTNLNNIQANPLFVSPDDFHLLSFSPALGRADKSYSPLIDRDGRVRDINPDAGAYERGLSAPSNFRIVR